MSAPGLRKGWCPGALQPMATGDGLLVRLRLTAGEMPAVLANSIAALALEHGNGALDLSQRANLQLRGVHESSLPALTDALYALGVLDASAEAEAVRNVMVSPLAGVDAQCADGRGLAHQLESRLSSDAALHRLPGKFGFAIDGGGAWPLRETASDVMLLACNSNGDAWRVRLAGSPTLSQALSAEAALEAALRVARAFLASDCLRMRDWVARDGAGKILQGRGLGADASYTAPLAADPKPGAYTLTTGSTIAVIGLPFGRIEAHQLRSLAAAAGAVPTFRLTPWRLLAVPMSNPAAASNLLAVAKSMGLAADPADPRVAMQACTGAPACPNGTTHTREDALRLVGLLAGQTWPRTILHVSGCAKGCAHRGAALVTLVARDGRYDVVCNGAVDDLPLRRGVSPEQLPQIIAETLRLNSRT